MIESRLGQALAERYPKAGDAEVARAAVSIAAAVHDLDRRGRSTAVRKTRGGRLEYSARSKARKPVNDLRRLEKLAKAGAPAYEWVRAWLEAHPDAIGFIAEKAGGVGFFTTRTICVERPALPDEYTPEECAALINGRQAVADTERMVPLSAPVPAPEAVLPYLPGAIRAAASVARSRYARDVAAGAVLRSIARLIGEPFAQPTNIGRGHARKGKAVDCLMWVDSFFETNHFANLFRSGDSLARVVSLSR